MEYIKQFLKGLLILILIAILGIESYFYFFKDEEIIGDINNPTKEEEEKVDTKNLVDIYTGYNLDNITKKTVKDKKAIYEIISGLKDEEIETKVNNKIKEKVENLKTKVKKDEYIYGTIISNFENTISILFATSSLNDLEPDSLEIYDMAIIRDGHLFDYADTLNLNLTTGDEITIKDVVNKTSALTIAVSKYGYDNLHKIKGIIAYGGLGENPEPDYSMVEDELLTLINKTQKDDFEFIYNQSTLKLFFENVNISVPRFCQDENDKKCKKYDDIAVDQNYHINTYILDIPMKSLIDNLLIYNKFKTDESIYKKPSTKIDLKFKDPDSENYQSKMIGNNTSLIDYNIPLYISDNKKLHDIVREKAIKEVTKVKTNKFNIYNMLGNADLVGGYDYIYYDVRNYSLDKDVYKKYRKQIYLDKFNYKSYEGRLSYKTYKDNGKDELGYEYLKKYLTNKYYYYYILDEKGNEVYEKDILNKEYLEEQIPEEWLSLGRHTTYDDLINNALIIMKPGYNYPNNLVIYDGLDGTLKLKYKNREKELTSDDEYSYQIEEKLFN